MTSFEIVFVNRLGRDSYDYNIYVYVYYRCRKMICKKNVIFIFFKLLGIH